MSTPLRPVPGPRGPRDLANVPAERNALGAMLASAEACKRGAEAFDVETFTRPELRTVFVALANWSARHPGELPDLPALADDVRTPNAATLLAELMEGALPHDLSGTQIAFLRDLEARRRLRGVLMDTLYRVEADAELPEIAEGLHAEAEALKGSVLASAANPFITASVTAAELLAQEIERPPFVLGGILPAGGVGILAGEPGAGKTWLAFQAARAIAEGTPFLGIPTTQGRAGLVLLETPDWAVQDRLRALGAGAWTDGVSVVTAEALGFSSLNVCDPVARGRLVEYARDARLSFLALDPLTFVHDGDENATHDAKRLMAALKDLALESGAAVLALHHERKGGIAGAGKGSDLDAVRGSTVLVTAPTLVVRLTAKHGTPCFVFAKVQAGKVPAPIFLERTDAGPLVVTETPATEAEGAERRRGRILDLLRAEPAPWGAEALRAALEAEGDGVTDSTIRNYLGVLMASGAVLRSRVRGAFEYRINPEAEPAGSVADS